MSHTNMGASQDKLVNDLRVLISDAEELLRSTAGQASNGALGLREKMHVNLQRAKDTLADAQAEVVNRAKAAGQATDRYVKDNPWKSIGVAAGVGALIALLFSSRR